MTAATRAQALHLPRRCVYCGLQGGLRYPCHASSLCIIFYGKCRLKHRSGVASASGNAYITGLNACVNTGYTKESDTSNVYIDLEIYDQDTLGGVHDDSAGKLHLSFSDIPKGPWGPDGNYAPGVKKYLDHGSTVWVYQK